MENISRGGTEGEGKYNGRRGRRESQSTQRNYFMNINFSFDSALFLFLKKIYQPLWLCGEKNRSDMKVMEVTRRRRRIGFFVMKKDGSNPVFSVLSKNRLLVPATKNAQQEKKQIDKVEIKGSCSHNGEFTRSGSAIFYTSTNALDFLGVISDQTSEDQHSYAANDIIDARALHEEVH